MSASSAIWCSISGTAAGRKLSWKTISPPNATTSFATLKSWSTCSTWNLVNSTKTCTTIRVASRLYYRTVPMPKYSVLFTRWIWCRRTRGIPYSGSERRIWRDWACHCSAHASELAYGMKLYTGNWLNRIICELCYFESLIFIFSSEHGLQ